MILFGHPEGFLSVVDWDRGWLPGGASGVGLHDLFLPEDSMWPFGRGSAGRAAVVSNHRMLSLAQYACRADELIAPWPNVADPGRAERLPT